MSLTKAAVIVWNNCKAEFILTNVSDQSCCNRVIQLQDWIHPHKCLWPKLLWSCETTARLNSSSQMSLTKAAVIVWNNCKAEFILTNVSDQSCCDRVKQLQGWIHPHNWLAANVSDQSCCAVSALNHRVGALYVPCTVVINVIIKACWQMAYIQSESCLMV